MKPVSYYVLRAKGLKRALVHQAVQADGKRLVNKKRAQLSQLQTRLPKKQLLDMDIEINSELVRLIAVWSPKEKRHTYLITNLNRQEFSALEVTHIYCMRWQVELLFKECKLITAYMLLIPKKPHYRNH
ncbi:MAG: transposase [Thiohalomonas sp.]|nr:transposase [Thiohalomonas sp.]